MLSGKNSELKPLLSCYIGLCSVFILPEYGDIWFENFELENYLSSVLCGIESRKFVFSMLFWNKFTLQYAILMLEFASLDFFFFLKCAYLYK